MANEGNLIQNSNRSPSELRENGRQGGIASGKARRLKAMMQQWAEDGGYELMVEKCEDNLDNPRFWEMAASILGEPPTTRIEAEIEDRTLHVFIDDGSND